MPCRHRSSAKSVHEPVANGDCVECHSAFHSKEVTKIAMAVHSTVPVAMSTSCNPVDIRLRMKNAQPVMSRTAVMIPPVIQSPSAFCGDSHSGHAVTFGNTRHAKSLEDNAQPVISLMVETWCIVVQQHQHHLQYLPCRVAPRLPSRKRRWTLLYQLPCAPRQPLPRRPPQNRRCALSQLPHLPDGQVEDTVTFMSHHIKRDKSRDTKPKKTMKRLALVLFISTLFVVLFTTSGTISGGRARWKGRTIPTATTARPPIAVWSATSPMVRLSTQKPLVGSATPARNSSDPRLHLLP